MVSPSVHLLSVSPFYGLGLRLVPLLRVFGGSERFRQRHLDAIGSADTRIAVDHLTLDHDLVAGAYKTAAGNWREWSEVGTAPRSGRATELPNKNPHRSQDCIVGAGTEKRQKSILAIPSICVEEFVGLISAVPCGRQAWDRRPACSPPLSYSAGSTSLFRIQSCRSS